MPAPAAFGPIIPRQRPAEWLRAGTGAFVGLLAAAAVERATGLGPAFLAPLGATAVLVMAVPNSPLAQPWSSVVGSMTAAAVAIPVALLVPMPWAAALAVGMAIMAMSALRALHPPGGAVALLTALAVDPARPFGILVPLMLGTLTLVLCAMIWARLTGRVYPMRGQAEAEAAFPRIGLHRDELDALLVRFRQGPNMGAADLGRLLAAAETEAALHRFDSTTCGDVMTRPLISVAPGAGLDEIAGLFAKNRIKSLPVVDPAGRMLGIIQQGDLVQGLLRAEDRRSRARLTAARMMRSGTPRVAVDLPIGALLDQLAGQGAQVVAVTDGPRLAGVITRSDVIALLLRDYERRTHPATVDASETSGPPAAGVS